MATLESLAIREEKARNRILKAAQMLAAQTGIEVPDIIGKIRERDPRTRAAVLSEDIAALLESMVQVTTQEVDADEGEQATEGESDGVHNDGQSSGTVASKATQPIKRSQASGGKRRR